MTVGSRTCHWQQQIYSEGEPQEDEFGAGVLWLRVSAFFHLVTLWYVLLQLLNMGFLRHFPFMVAEVFHAALCPGRARLTSTWQYFVKEIFNYQNSVGDRFSCRFGAGGGGMDFCAGQESCSYTAGGRDRNWRYQQTSFLGVLYFILDIASSTCLTTQLIVQSETQLKSIANYIYV